MLVIEHNLDVIKTADWSGPRGEPSDQGMVSQGRMCDGPPEYLTVYSLLERLPSRCLRGVATGTSRRRPSR